MVLPIVREVTIPVSTMLVVTAVWIHDYWGTSAFSRYSQCRLYVDAVVGSGDVCRGHCISQRVTTNTLTRGERASGVVCFGPWNLSVDHEVTTRQLGSIIALADISSRYCCATRYELRVLTEYESTNVFFANAFEVRYVDRPVTAIDIVQL